MGHLDPAAIKAALLPAVVKAMLRLLEDSLSHQHQHHYSSPTCFRQQRIKKKKKIFTLFWLFIVSSWLTELSLQRTNYIKVYHN